jgi:hypothetical protein
MAQAITAITAALGLPPVPTTTDPAVGNASASGTALAGGFAASRFATKQGSDPATCNLYSITTNQAAIAAPFRVVNRYVGNLAPMPGVFPDYPAPVVRNTDTGRELSMMR